MSDNSTLDANSAHPAEVCGVDEAPIAYWTNERPGDWQYGSCGHRHRSLEAAERCLQRARLGYTRAGGYCPWYTVAYDSDGREVPYGEWARA